MGTEVSSSALIPGKWCPRSEYNFWKGYFTHIPATIANLYNGLRRIKITLLSRDHVPSFEELGDLHKALHKEGIFVDGMYKEVRRNN